MTIASQARRLAKLLAQHGRKVVFAESCTGGLVSGALTAIPGISRYHCGGLIVYRNATKMAYLGIKQPILEDPGPVSPQVASLMAQGVLKKTPEADLALSVTGHLGPDAPPELDGQVFLAIASRPAARSSRLAVTAHSLNCAKIVGRTPRQRWVVERALTVLADCLQQTPPLRPSASFRR